MKSSRSCFLRSLRVVLITLLSTARARGPVVRPRARAGFRLPGESLPALRLEVVPRQRQLLLGDRRMVLLAERHRALQPLVALDAVQAVLQLVRVGRADLLDHLAD